MGELRESSEYVQKAAWEAGIQHRT